MLNSSTISPTVTDVAPEEVLYHLIMTFNLAVICEAISTFGTLTNVFNMIVFFKMGFSEQINITLFGLAVSDLCSLVALMWQNLCFNPYFTALDLAFDPYDIQYLTAGMPHVLFTRITASLTAFITFERCLCIYLPLKVKNIINPGRVKVVVSSVYALNIFCLVPFYYANRLGPKFFLHKNKTLVGLIFGKDRILIDKIVFAIVNVIIPFSTFIVVVVCTMIIVVKMKEKAKWRVKTSDTSINNRDQKVSRMVLTISALFLICFTPMTMVFVSMVIVPEFSIEGKYNGLLLTLCSFSFVFEALNSSLNIFIYYKMSTKFRETFLHLIRKRTQ